MKIADVVVARQVGELLANDPMQQLLVRRFGLALRSFWSISSRLSFSSGPSRSAFGAGHTVNVFEPPAGFVAHEEVNVLPFPFRLGDVIAQPPAQMV